MDTRKFKAPIFCANCGGMGHIYKNCNHPVTSYGIICYRLVVNPVTNSIHPLYLMVQRKDSMSYVEFLRGKYQLENRSYILKLFSNMTKEEHHRIMMTLNGGGTFEKLWKDLWQVQDCRNFEKEYMEARDKFEVLQKGYYLKYNNTTIFFDLGYILSEAPAAHETTEWGFPKGRRNINEDDVHCALREFMEETGYAMSQIKIHIDVKPLEEIFSGTNRVRYKHVYYLAQLADSEMSVCVPPPRICSATEIRDVKWFSYHDAQALLRHYNVERKELFRRVNQNVLKNLYSYSKRFTTHAIAKNESPTTFGTAR